jgi:hypothetical protein
VSETERKRYEGVWAANRGLLVADGTTGADDRVHAYVVKDIWARSGLGEAVLAQVWELVAGGGLAATADAQQDRQRERGSTTTTARGRPDTRALGPEFDGSSSFSSLSATEPKPKPKHLPRSLGRDEFVVGMWLVDRAREGRRLPAEVGSSVWESARRLMAGIRTR